MDHVAKDPVANSLTPRILVPTDFSDESEAALNYALALARAIGAEVDVLHVWDLRVEGRLGGRAVVIAPEALAEAASCSEAAAYGIQIRGRLEFGDPSETILRVLDAEAFDLVVMGMHTRPRLAHWLGFRTTSRVRAKAPCPLLTVRSSTNPPPPPISRARAVTVAVEGAIDAVGEEEDDDEPPPDTRPSASPMVSFPIVGQH